MKLIKRQNKITYKKISVTVTAGLLSGLMTLTLTGCGKLDLNANLNASTSAKLTNTFDAAQPDPAALQLLNGTYWVDQTSCHRTQSGGGSFSFIYFNGSKFEKTNEIYSDPSCSQLLAWTFEVADVEIRQIPSSQQRIMKLTFQQMSAMSYNSTSIYRMNLSGECSYSNWAQNLKLNISGRYCLGPKSWPSVNTSEIHNLNLGSSILVIDSDVYSKY